MAGGKTLRIERDPKLASLSADDRDLAHAADLLDGLLELGGELPQLESRVTRAPKRHGENRHVVDRSRLHERGRRAGRNDVGMSGELFLQAYRAPLFVFTDPKAHDDLRHSGH